MPLCGPALGVGVAARSPSSENLGCRLVPPPLGGRSGWFVPPSWEDRSSRVVPPLPPGRVASVVVSPPLGRRGWCLFTTGPGLVAPPRSCDLLLGGWLPGSLHSSAPLLLVEPRLNIFVLLTNHTPTYLSRSYFPNLWHLVILIFSSIPKTIYNKMTITFNQVFHGRLIPNLELTFSRLNISNWFIHWLIFFSILPLSA